MKVFRLIPVVCLLLASAPAMAEEPEWLNKVRDSIRSEYKKAPWTEHAYYGPSRCDKSRDLYVQYLNEFKSKQKPGNPFVKKTDAILADLKENGDSFFVRYEFTNDHPRAGQLRRSKIYYVMKSPKGYTLETLGTTQDSDIDQDRNSTYIKTRARVSIHEETATLKHDLGDKPMN